jgi:hypothetical protein
MPVVNLALCCLAFSAAPTFAVRQVTPKAPFLTRLIEAEADTRVHSMLFELRWSNRGTDGLLFPGGEASGTLIRSMEPSTGCRVELESFHDLTQPGRIRNYSRSILMLSNASIEMEARPGGRLFRIGPGGHPIAKVIDRLVFGATCGGVVESQGSSLSSVLALGGAALVEAGDGPALITLESAQHRCVIQAHSTANLVSVRSISVYDHGGHLTRLVECQFAGFPGSDERGSIAAVTAFAIPSQIVEKHFDTQGGLEKLVELTISRCVMHSAGLGKEHGMFQASAGDRVIDLVSQEVYECRDVPGGDAKVADNSPLTNAEHRILTFLPGFRSQNRSVDAIEGVLREFGQDASSTDIAQILGVGPCWIRTVTLMDIAETLECLGLRVRMATAPMNLGSRTICLLPEDGDFTILTDLSRVSPNDPRLKLWVDPIEGTPPSLTPTVSNRVVRPSHHRRVSLFLPPGSTLIAVHEPDHSRAALLDCRRFHQSGALYREISFEVLSRGKPTTGVEELLFSVRGLNGTHQLVPVAILPD